MADLMVPFPALELHGGMTLMFRALDPTTGVNVADVLVTDISIYADQTDDDAGVADFVTPIFPYGPGGV